MSEFPRGKSRNWKPSRNETPEPRIRKSLGFKVATNSGFLFVCFFNLLVLLPLGSHTHYTVLIWSFILAHLCTEARVLASFSPGSNNERVTLICTLIPCSQVPMACGSGQPQYLLVGWTTFLLLLSSRIIDIKMWSLQKKRKLTFCFDFVEVTYLLQVLSEGKISKTSSWHKKHQLYCLRIVSFSIQFLNCL